MPLERDPQSISIPANVSLATKQFYGVSITAAGKVVLGTAVDEPIIGILYNKPSAADAAAEVAVGGVARMIAGEAIDAGDLVTVDSAGKGAVAGAGSTDRYVVGLALSQAGADGDLFEVLVNPQHRGDAA